MKQLLEKLIEDKALNYQALVLKYYHKLGLNEVEAVLLIRLQSLIEKDIGLIKPKLLAKTLSLSETDTESLLNQLIEKGFLTIELIEAADGKSQEVFRTDYFLSALTLYLNRKNSDDDKHIHYAYVDALESILQKPLSPIDIEIVSKWIHDDAYDLDMVKAAALSALKKPNPTVRMIDRLLFNEVKPVQVKPTRKKDVLKEFHKLWDE